MRRPLRDKISLGPEGWPLGHLRSTAAVSYVGVDAARNPRGQRVYRVVVGAYLRAAEAELARRIVARVTGHKAVVKPL